MVWVCTICILLLLCYRLVCGKSDDRRYYIYGDALGAAGRNVTVRGCVDRIESKNASCYLYLSDISVESNLPTINNTYLSRLILSCPELPDVLPGYQIFAEGVLCDWDTATNPGQFDARSYYREKGIYYIMYEKNYEVVSDKADRYRTALLHLKERLQNVIHTALPEKQAGIITTMLLGDKSALDLDIRTLYQQNGIGHLLAISGLHITILCMALYQLLLLCRFPRPAAVAVTIAMLWSYGELTGFSISTSRAVIMMCLYLCAGLLGRSYDLLSAMACSALILLLQKPFAITSCSFLLSYAAILGVALVYPVLWECVYGDAQMQRRRKRRLHRMEREYKSKGSGGVVLWWLVTIREMLLQTLLMSISIQISTLPVMLYFYYEVPTYGVLLNILVLPLASFLIVWAAIAALSGLFLPVLAKFLFASVSLILRFYECLCSAFMKLPMPVTLIGRPEMYQIAGYLLCAILAVWLWQRFGARRAPLYLWAIGAICILLPAFSADLTMTFLDVGQGDGIVIQTSDHRAILIDGGSTSEKQVGEYRIKPFLKYHGVSEIDYMIMSHADEDHISGQMELLENSGKPGNIRVRHLLLPEPSDRYRQEEGYQRLLQLAQKVGVPVSYLHTGNCLQIGDIQLFCLHPDPGFDGGSANAYSTSLSISWHGIHFLLCGDLEKAGEDVVLERLQAMSAGQTASPANAGGISPEIPDHYDVLKLSHHGSKNSTSEAFLRQVQPSLALISCGRNNRYGHPHAELLERLEATSAHVLRTDEQGAIKLLFSVD